MFKNHCRLLCTSNQILLALAAWTAASALSSVEAKAARYNDIVHGWCGAAAKLDAKPKDGGEAMSSDAIWKRYEEVIAKFRAGESDSAFALARKLLADVRDEDLERVTITKTFSGTDERSFSLLRELWALRIAGEARGKRKVSALAYSCQMLKVLEDAERDVSDKYHLNFHVEVIAETLAEAEYLEEAEILYRYALFLLNKSEETRCFTVFIGRRLCDGLIRSLIRQNKAQEAAKHLRSWLTAVGNDVGMRHQDYAVAVKTALDIAEENETAGDDGLSAVLEAAPEFVTQEQSRGGDSFVGPGLVTARLFLAAYTIGTEHFKKRGRPEEAKAAAVNGAALARHVAIAMTREGQAADQETAELLQSVVSLGLKLHTLAGQPLNAMLFQEWVQRPMLFDVFKDGLRREQAEDRATDAGWVYFKGGFTDFEEEIAKLPKPPAEITDETTTLVERVVQAFEKAQGPYHWQAIASVVTLAKYHAWRGDRAAAISAAETATDRIRKMMVLDLFGRETWQTHLTRWRDFLGWYEDLLAQDDGRSPEDIERYVAVSQLLNQTRTTWAVAAMASRLASGMDPLSEPLRAHQALLDRLVVLEDCVMTEKTCSDGNDADPAIGMKDINRMHAVMEELDTSAKRLGSINPEFAALASPSPITISELQRKSLGNDEVLYVLDWSDDRVRAWAVTASSAEIHTIASGGGVKELAETVEALRCGLDAASWGGAGEKLCQARLSATFTSEDAIAKKPLPFDHARAAGLYKKLFGKFEELLKKPDGSRSILFVPAGPLQQLPLHVLLTEPSTPNGALQWLARRHAVSVLPSVASLKAMRKQNDGASVEKKPYVAFANPLLTGSPKRKKDATRALLAASKSDCAKVAAHQELDKLADLLPGFSPTNLGGQADVAALSPVPHTADLACGVAHGLGVGEEDVYLAARATESNVKSLSKSGDLASYAVVNFATHGAIAGELSEGTEPGLVLTPPKARTELDDGYLTASEVVSLRMDADWVVLSACNTAAPEAADAEALSGLARAFFYAGARSLLVSHWAVREDAAAHLIPHAIRVASEKSRPGRAEAIRQAMLSLIDGGDAEKSHPAYWAPFVLVGKGAAEQ